MVILEMCHSPPGHSYSLALQVESSNSLVFIHLKKENSGPKLIKAQEHEKKKKKKGDMWPMMKENSPWLNVFLHEAATGLWKCLPFSCNKKWSSSPLPTIFFSRISVSPACLRLDRICFKLGHRCGKLEDIILPSAQPLHTVGKKS